MSGCFAPFAWLSPLPGLGKSRKFGDSHSATSHLSLLPQGHCSKDKASKKTVPGLGAQLASPQGAP